MTECLIIRLLVLVGVCLGVRAEEAGYENPSCGGKTVIVQLFEWKWTDIALECQRFLAPAGFCGVQVSPPNEHAIITADYPHPWWQRYQPVSYKLVSRSGTEEEFFDMVHRCNAVGVRIFVDVVVNHMAAVGRAGVGSAGSTFNGTERDFPGVPYTAQDFTPREMCPSKDGSVTDYNDPRNVRNCYLEGLCDLYGASEHVRQEVGRYLSRMVDAGVAGFRMDASKHMWPQDLRFMMDLTSDLNISHGFPHNTRPFFFQEVVDRKDGAVTVQEYYGLGRITDFRYCQKVAWGVQDPAQLVGVYDPAWGMADPDKAFVFVDNHDTQRGHRGHGDQLSYRWPRDYQLGVAFTLAQPYGFTRIMSSYDFGSDTNAGPPHLDDYRTADVVINEKHKCEGGWVCEHRWNTLYKMVRFRNAVVGTGWWTNYYSDGNVVAFSRGSRGFFLLVKNGTVSQTFQTSLPAGTYEDVVSCMSVTVKDDGTAEISTREEQPVLAICVACNCSEPFRTPPSPQQPDGMATTTTTPDEVSTQPTTEGVTTPAGQTSSSITEGVHRTVIFIRKQTTEGQDLFLRGGLDVGRRPGCLEHTQTVHCAIDMTTNPLGATSHYAKYDSWRLGDTRLDWMGGQVGQGTYRGQPASGTAMAWTSNHSSSPGYQELNTFGDHYWMADVNLDCSQTKAGWFEVKAFLTHANGGWEADITQETPCSGTAGGLPPYTSRNHLGRCGHFNVFAFNASVCMINTF
ncbi:alpha-amylase-like isoform X2 [Panulirus ornatus]|uniref:alpha-amylase-like isoform X2 n=1 Tax=Panulirus ornatus TaxID=150431 RepID=UPI003A88FC13